MFKAYTCFVFFHLQVILEWDYFRNYMIGTRNSFEEEGYITYALDGAALRPIIEADALR